MQPNVIDMYHGDNREAIPNFAMMKIAGVWGIIHKITQGSHYIDPKASDRIKAAQDAGLLVGGYCFLDATDGETQADFYLDRLNAILPHALPDAGFLNAADYEKLNNDTASLKQLYDFMSFVDKNGPAGHLSVCYSSDLIRETLLPPKGGHVDTSMVGVDNFMAQHRLWLAEYGPHENIPWPWNIDWKTAWLWQYKANGTVPGIIGQTDLNFYAGTNAQLIQEWKAGPIGLSNPANQQNLTSQRGQMPPA